MSENNASSAATAEAPSASAASHTPKLRSCVTCRSRKVRCDKRSPCSNCRRANITCVVPSTDRPPRWARRLERLPNNAALASDPGVGQVMERLQALEGLVKDLSSQLEQAHAAANSAAGASSVANREADDPGSASSARDSENTQMQFGRLVLQDSSRSRYISSGFWSRVGYELDELKMDTRRLAEDDLDASEDEVSTEEVTPATSSQGLERTPSERHGFLFQHNLSPTASSTNDFHPLPSQIPFLLDVFSENVNSVSQIVHMPTITKMMRDLRTGDMASLTPANEALMFSIYYAAITSMEEEDVTTNFGCTKTELNLKYRLGLEHALAKADFLNAPNLVLVQAFTIFLFLLRRHESPAFVWIMTGLAIRMAQAIGLHRDGANFKHLKPYEIEMRRRVWWAVCMLDTRASEDQGTDLTIANDSFDTKLPLNINDTDISPDSAQIPTERQGPSDMFFVRMMYEMGDVMRKMTVLIVNDGPQNLEIQNRLLNELYQIAEKNQKKYLTKSNSIMFWVTITIARLVVAKMTLLIYFPALFFSPSEHFSEETRAKLFVSAIEVAEYNHALNAETKCRQWRWVYQTCTHWYSIVYLLIEISRRQWSPMVERAWISLHSSWLIPAGVYTDKNKRIWVPLQKLMSKARKHRDVELERLRGDANAAERVEMEDSKIPMPTSSGPIPAGHNAVDFFSEHWRQLVAMPKGPQSGSITHAPFGTGTSNPINAGSRPVFNAGDATSSMSFEPPFLGASGHIVAQNPSPSSHAVGIESVLNQTFGSSNDQLPAASGDWPFGQTMGAGFVSWPWTDADPSIDLDNDVNWYNWIESAKCMEWEAYPSNNRHV